MSPGRTFGAVFFRKVLDANWVPPDIVVGETQTLLFASRMLAGNGVEVHAIKDVVDLACTPEDKVFLLHYRIADIFPQFRPTKNMLQLTLNNTT